MEDEPGGPGADPQDTRRRLAAEVQELRGALRLVATGAASRVTLAGLRFGDELAARFGAEAEAQGIRLEPLFWPEDKGCDLVVRRIDD